MPCGVVAVAAEAESCRHFGAAMQVGGRGHLLLLMGRGQLLCHPWIRGLLRLRPDRPEDLVHTLVAVVEVEASWLVAATEHMLVEAA